MSEELEIYPITSYDVIRILGSLKIEDLESYLNQLQD
jgi:hypothetical protein